MTRYACVSSPVIQACWKAYRHRKNLTDAVPALDEPDIHILLAETYEADVWTDSHPNPLIRDIAPLSSDWALAVVGDCILYTLEDRRSGRQGSTLPQSDWDFFHHRAWSFFQRALDSPFLSPLLDYQGMFFEIAQEYRFKNSMHAVQLMKRSIVHSFAHQGGLNGLSLLSDLAEAYFWAKQRSQCLKLFTSLLENSPDHIWLYNSLALLFSDFEMREWTQLACQRGLDLIDKQGDSDNLRSQLQDTWEQANTLDSSKDAILNQEEATVALRIQLNKGFDHGGQQLPPEALARKLLPDWGNIQCKTGPPPIKLPPRTPTPTKPTHSKTGRNQPCWCGSGKKYKKCHLKR